MYQLILLFFFLTFVNKLQANDIIVVTADRIALSENRASAAVILIDQNELAKMPGSNLNDILAKQSGLHLAQQGPAGGNSSLFFRGAEARHVLVMIDGIIVNDPSNPSGQFDFGHLSTDMVEKIEILKGSQSVLYGSDAIAGVISITTKQGYQEQIRLTTGSWDSHSITAQTGQKNLRLAAHHQKTKGFSAAKSHHGEATTPDGREMTDIKFHLKSDPTRFGIFAFDFKYLTDFFDIDGYDNNGNFVDMPGNESLQKENQSAISWSKDFSQNSSSSLKLSRHDIRREIIESGNISHFHGLSHQVLAQYQQRWNQYHHSTLGLEARYDEMKSGERYKKKGHAPFVFQRFDHDHFFASAGLRLNKEDYSDSFLSTQATVGYIFSFTTVKLNYSTGFKAPSLFQLFDPLYGNEKLEAEKSKHMEISSIFELYPERLSLDLSLFKTQLKNRFDFDPQSFRTINGGQAQIKGVEVTFKGHITTWWEFQLGLQNIEAKDEATGQFLARRPKQMAQMGHHFNLSTQTSLYINTQYVSSRREANGRQMSPYQLWNIFFQHQINKQIDLSLNLNNLFDKDYENIADYQTPGRAWTVGLNYVF